MFVKLTSSGGHRYVQLVESFRDEEGRPRQRTVATLGRADRFEQVDKLIDGLRRATGRDPLAAPAVQFESAVALGHVWALSELWRQLGLDALGPVMRRARSEVDALALVRAMVFNRLCDPRSKLGVLEWLQTVALPGLSAVTHQQLLRAMDSLQANQAAVEDTLGCLVRPLLDAELAVVFYDLTTVAVEGATVLPDDVRAVGRAKSGLLERQFVLSLVQTREGLPIAHEVHPGNVAEVKTLLPTIRRIVAKHAVTRVVLVADRGLLSLDNLQALRGITLPTGKALEFVLAVPAARYREFAELVAPLHQRHAKSRGAWSDECGYDGLRLVVAHDAEQASERSGQRAARIAELETLAEQWAGKLTAQDGGRRFRGRPLSDSGVKARFYHAVQEASLGHVIEVDLHGELFNYEIREDVLQRLQLLDGKLLLVTNSPEPGAEIVARYKDLADIERGFRVLKSDIEIGPVYHRLPKRIRAHAAICFIALLMQRVMRQRLKAAGSQYSPQHALRLLARIHQHRIRLNGQATSGVSAIEREQLKLFAELEIARPTA
jgi:hypothetical protein